MNTHHLSPDEIVDYLRRELAPDADARALAHLESCASCTAAYDAEARLSDALRHYARANERELPQGVVHAIRDAIERDAQAPSFAQRVAAWFRPVILAPTVAALAIAVAAAIWLRPHAALPTIDAAYYIDDHAALTSTVPFNEGMALPSVLEHESAAAPARTVATTGGTIAVYASR